MRITQDYLIKVAKDHTGKRIRTERDLLAAYLVGSVLEDDPLLGGTTDIDLVLIHARNPKVEREILRVNEDIHLDVVHHTDTVYQQPRALRADPWLGTAVQNHPALLYDVRHWFEFTQASVGSQFYRADHTLERSRQLLQSARNGWIELSESRMTFARKVARFITAVEESANAIASLSGSPITRRRFLLELPDRLEAVSASGLLAGVVGLLGLESLPGETVLETLPDWKNTFLAAGTQPHATAELHPLRLDYNLRAITALAEGDEVPAAGYLLLATWTEAITLLPSASPEYIRWLQMVKSVGLGRETLDEKIHSLDAFLDRTEEVLDDWAEKAGA